MSSFHKAVEDCLHLLKGIDKNFVILIFDSDHNRSFSGVLICKFKVVMNSKGQPQARDLEKAVEPVENEAYIKTPYLHRS